MTVKLIKLAITAMTEVTTTPTVEKFFYQVATETTGTDPDGTELTIAVGEFWDDTGAEATGLPVLENANSYVNVYINGVLQMDGLFNYTAGSGEPFAGGELVITVPSGETLLKDTPIVLEITNFTPTGDTTVTS